MAPGSLLLLLLLEEARPGEASSCFVAAAIGVAKILRTLAKVATPTCPRHNLYRPRPSAQDQAHLS